MALSATSDNDPAVQAFVATPHAPFTATTAKLAEQLELPPPCSPVHVHDHGPEPDTAEAEPALHRPEEGADETLVPLAGPQPPATIGAQFGGVVMDELTLVVPPVSLLDL